MTGYIDPTLGVFVDGWPGQAVDTMCGWGSSEKHTRGVREGLREILRQYPITAMNDAGCGDLVWMRTVDLSGVDYHGYDAHERPSWPELRACGFRLEVIDITASEMRSADLIICRDVFIHLPNDMILMALKQFRESSRLLLTTSYLSDDSRPDSAFSNAHRIATPSLRHAKLDLRLPPFDLGEPTFRIAEDLPNKHLGLWSLRQ